METFLINFFRKINDPGLDYVVFIGEKLETLFICTIDSNSNFPGNHILCYLIDDLKFDIKG